MAEYLIQDTTLTGIADAIRSKTGSTDAIKVSDMASKIEGISVGGGTVDGVHYVTFMSEDGSTELYKRPVADGDDCADPVIRGLISAPTKESTVQYEYSFVGWATTANGAWDETALDAVTEDKTVYAVFAAAVRYYTITFYDDDGVTVLATKSVAYGATPSYTPTKEGYGFDGWTPELTTVTGDASYTASWFSQIAGGIVTTNVMWSLAGDGVLTIYGAGAMIDYTASSAQPWYSYKADITKIVVEEGITYIGKLNFYGLTNAKSAVIADSVISTGTYVFSGCTRLTALDLGNGITSISSYFAYECSSLTSVTIPDSVTTINTQAFYNCSAMTSVVIGSEVTEIWDYAFRGTGLTEATFKDTSSWYYANTSKPSTLINGIDVTNKTTAAKGLSDTYTQYVLIKK